jgi:HEAT repeat protein
MTLAQRLASPVVEECRAAIAELGVRTDPTVEELAALAACLGHARKAIQRPAAEAFAALAACGLAVEAVLLPGLEAPTARQRWGAAFALALLGQPPPGVLPVVVEALGSDDGDLRWAAARILPRVADRPTTIALLRDLVGRGNPPQRKMAAYCLRDLEARAPEIEAELLARLDDGDRDVRLAAVAALARLAVAREHVAGRLLGVLAADEPPVRRAAAAALGVVGDASPPVLDALRAAAAGPDAGLARAAERALAMLRPRTGPAPR